MKKGKWSGVKVLKLRRIEALSPLLWRGAEGEVDIRHLSQMAFSTLLLT
jgi:hypothetical protein